ncbi:hypothetical protein KY285_014321 [Solanum tuberosum]|nr:hypothetical protein KY285_014321 [Solanum tuberosum]
MDTTLSVLEMQQLYNRSKQVVWVVRIKHMVEEELVETFGTAFSVIDMNDCQYVGLNNSDSLSVGQTLLHIGHPNNFVGSFLTGKIAFECEGNIEIPTTNLTCKSYTPTALETTPEYRIMGDIWNRHVFVDPRSFTYEKNLHPFVPVIQMYGFVCGEGCSGGPVFNFRGEVVGMVAMSANGYEIAIHVAILRETVRLFKEQHSDDEDGKRKAIPDPKFQAGDSKKFKEHQADRKGKGKGKDSFIGASSVPEIWELGIKELLALVSIRSFKSKLF